MNKEEIKSLKNNIMKTEDYRILELLFGKLKSEIKANNFCIIPEYIQNGVYIGAYDVTGNLIAKAQAVNIKKCVLKINKLIKQKKE